MEDARDVPRNFVNYGVPDWHQVEERNLTKVRCTLRQLVRDWSEEGIRERETNYSPLLDALERHKPITEAMRAGTEEPPKVVCPGSGLGRLPFEAVCRGYSAVGNEFSYHMLFVADYILNHSQEKGEYVIYPHVTSLRHRKRGADYARGVSIPDILPGQYLMERKCPLSELSVMTGEFAEVVKDLPLMFDALLTPFFIDTAKNFVLYVRTFATILKESAMWINIGPLLWHYATQAEDCSIELSWTQCRKIICEYFDFLEEERDREVYYTVDNEALQSTVYKCIYFVARRNNVPVTGTSNPVFD